MKSNFPKIPLLLSAIFFIFSCLAFLFFYRMVNDKNQVSQLNEAEWQSEAQRRDEIKALDRSIEVIEKEKAQLEIHFAQSSNIVPFLDTIDGLASLVDVQAEVTSVNPLDKNGGLMVGMQASGTFNDLYRFLALLENSPYELEFLGMNLEREAVLDPGGKNVPVSKWHVVFKLRLISFIR